MLKSPYAALYNEAALARLAENPRNKIYVLSDPIEAWVDGGIPPVHCVIKVSLEGVISGYPTISKEDSGPSSVNYFFRFFSDLPGAEMVGCRIVQVSAMEEDRIATALDLLTRYYDGDMAQGMVLATESEGQAYRVVCGRRLVNAHYMGVLVEPTVDDVQIWENRGFNPFYIGSHRSVQQNNQPRVGCVMFKALGDYGSIIEANEACTLENLFMKLCTNLMLLSHMGLDRADPLLVKSIMKRHLEMVKAKGAVDAKNLRMLDETRVNAFLERAHAHTAEDVESEMSKVANAYFSGELSFDITDDEETLLVLTGCIKLSFGTTARRLNIVYEEFLTSVRELLGRVMDCRNTLVPDVVQDEAPGFQGNAGGFRLFASSETVDDN